MRVLASIITKLLYGAGQAVYAFVVNKLHSLILAIGRTFNMSLIYAY